MARVVFVGKKPELDALREGLERFGEGWDMCFLTTPEGAFEAVAAASSAVVVADWDEVDSQGLSLCRKVKELAAPPAGIACYVIGVTGGDEVDRQGRLENLYSIVDDFVRRPFEPAELAARIRVGLRVVRAERVLRESNDELRNMVVTDPLTGLLTRRRGSEVLGAELARVARGQQDLMVVKVAIDGFDRIVEAHGPDAADAVLRQIATRYLRGSRVYDAAVRWEPAEFLVVLPHTRREHAQTVATRMQRLVAGSPVTVAPDLVVPVAACFGVTAVRSGATVRLSKLVRLVDEALDRARQQGANAVAYSFVP